MSDRPADITCRELVELVSDYVEGDLDPAERQRFEQHLEACEGCAVYVEQIRATIEAGGRLGPEQLEPGVRDGMIEAFRGLGR